MNDQFRENVFSVSEFILRGSVLFVFVCFFALPLLMACGIKSNRGEETSSHPAEQKSQSLTVTTSRGDTGSSFEDATKIVVQDDLHPWDDAAKTGGARIEEKNTVPNGDSMPPELSRESAAESCSTLQANRCVSCCEDAFSFGSDKWDQCVATCPQLNVQQLTSEY